MYEVYDFAHQTWGGGGQRPYNQYTEHPRCKTATPQVFGQSYNIVDDRRYSKHRKTPGAKKQQKS